MDWRGFPQENSVPCQPDDEEGWKIGKRPPFSLDTPINWAADPHHDTSWRMWLNSWHPLEPLLLAYDQTGRRPYLEFANRMALDWIEQHIVQDAKIRSLGTTWPSDGERRCWANSLTPISTTTCSTTTA